jgi:hypothetical protein
MDQVEQNADLMALIREFRLWQKLEKLAREERLALISCDFPSLAFLTSQKNQTLHQLTDLQRSRTAGMTMADETGSSWGSIPWLFDNVPGAGAHQGDKSGASCMVLGIKSLAEQIKELSQGNNALAECTMKHVWALQSWIQQENLKSMPILNSSLLAIRNLTFEPLPILADQTESGTTGLGRSYTLREPAVAGKVLPKELPTVPVRN